MNSTFFAPSAMDLLLTVPRLAQRAGAFAFNYVPEQLDFLVDKVRNGGSMVAAPTTMNGSVANTTASFTQMSSPPVIPSMQFTAQSLSDEPALFSFKNIREMGGLM